MPKTAKIINHLALVKCICFLSCTTTTAAIKIDNRTERGTAISTGIKSMSNGTATRDSPKPKVERTTVAMKMTIKIYSVIKFIFNQANLQTEI